MSFIPKNSNKTQKRSYFLGEIAIGVFSIGEIAIAILPILMIAIGAVPVTSEIAIVVRRCGSFRLARCVGRSSEALREEMRV